MLKTLLRIKESLRDYVAGSAYVLAHLALHERRAGALMLGDTARSRPSESQPERPLVAAARPGLAKAAPRRGELARARSAGGSASA